MFHCDKCPEKFTNFIDLRSHKITHTEKCRKVCVQKGELDLHKKQLIRLSVEFEKVEGRSFAARQKQNSIFKVF